MIHPNTPETTFNTVAAVDDSFTHFLRDLSGEDGLHVTINHSALQEAISDSGLAETDPLALVISAEANEIHTVIAKSPTIYKSQSIPKDHGRLKNQTTTQQVLQASILSNLLEMSVNQGRHPKELGKRLKTPAVENLKRRAKVSAGFIAGMAPTAAMIEIVNTKSSLAVTLASGAYIGYLASRDIYNSLEPRKPIEEDKGLILGYRPFVDFTFDSPTE